MKTNKKQRQERKKRKKETRRIVKMHGDKKRLRTKANEELKILIQLFDKDVTCELDLLVEIKKHLESSQKELTYFGYRGINIGVVVAVLTSLVTAQSLPVIFSLSEKVSSMQSLMDKIILFVILVISIMIMALLFIYVFWKVVSPFFEGEKKIRDQIYVNEYMIKTLEEKIKKIN